MFSVPHRRFVFHAKVDGHASVTPGGVVGCAHAVRRGRQRPPTARRDHRRITVLTAGDLFRCGGSACEGMRSTRISCELKRTRRRCSERGRSSPPDGRRVDEMRGDPIPLAHPTRGVSLDPV